MPSPSASSSPLGPLSELLGQHPRIALHGLCGTGKTSLLFERYRGLLAEGHPSETILAFVSSSTKTRWHEALAEQPPAPAGEWQFYTFLGWVQRELVDWWLVVEASGQLPTSERQAQRHQAHVLDLARVSLAQYLMARQTAPFRLEREWDARLNTAASFQVVHMLDSLGRSVEHGLPFSGIGDRLSRAWCGPAHVAECLQELQEALGHYKDWMLRQRVLDHALQLSVYQDYLWPLPAYQESVRARARHLLVDDLEESYPLAQTIVEALAGQAESVLLVRNTPGGLREYVGADPLGADRMLESYTPCLLPETACKAPAELRELGRAMYRSLCGEKPERVAFGDRLIDRLAFPSRLEMLQAVVKDVRGLLERGTPASEIVLLAPTLDPFLIWQLRQELAALGTPLSLMAGTNRLVDHRAVRMFVCLAKAAHPGWGVRPARHEWLELLEVMLGLDPLRTAALAFSLLDDGELVDPARLAELDWSAGSREEYRRLYDWLLEARSREARPIDSFLRHAFAELWAPMARRAHGAQAWLEQEQTAQEVSQLEQLIEAAEHFRELVGGLEELPEAAIGKRFVAYLLGGTLAERPFRRAPGETALTLATASKYAEDGPPVLYQFWLDFASTGWRKSDARELTNPRVLSRHWGGGRYTPEQQEADENAKLGRILWTNCLKVRRGVMAYASLVDAEGREHAGDLPHLLTTLRASQYAGLEVRS